MSSTIKGKLPDLQLKRQQSQSLAQQKSQATAGHLNQLKKIKEAVHQSRNELRALNESKAAVNHIVQKNNRDESVEEMPATDNSRLYTRQGRMENLEEDYAVSEDTLEKELPVEEEVGAALPEETGVYGMETDDNFYKVQDRGNNVSEDAFGYYIDAYAPEGEKDSVRVSISNDKAIISGSRKAQNELQQFDKKITTNNYQTFREEFKFAQPVISEGMTREREGDYIRFFIPKLSAKINNNT